MKKSLFFCLLPLLSMGLLQAQDDKAVLQSRTAGTDALQMNSGAKPEGEEFLTVPLQLTAEDGGFLPEVAGTSLWIYDAPTKTIFVEGVNRTEREPLVTKDVVLPKGTYRIGWEYLAGYVQAYMVGADVAYVLMVDPYSVRMVQKGDDVANGTELYSNDLACTDGKLVYENRTFSVPEDDTVYFAFVPTTRDLVYTNTDDTTYIPDGFMLGFKSLTVDSYVDNDMSVETVYTSLGHLSPLSQVNAEHEFRATIRNKGKETDSVVVSVFDTENPEKVYGQSAKVGIAMNEEVEIETVAKIEGITAGYEGSVSVKVDIVGKEDGNAYDNTWDYSLKVTDSVLTYDIMTEEDLADAPSVVGAFQTEISFGMLYDVKAMDTLTSFTVGWGPDGIYGLNKIAFYRWNEETDRADYLMYETDPFYRLDSSMGFSQVFPSRHLVLNPGRYFVEFNQLQPAYAAVATDNTEGGIMYVSSTASGALNPQTQYGYAALRLNFGQSNAEVMARDYEVLSIDEPDASGQYAQNEEVKATIVNNGVLDITDSAWVFCEVDGVLQDSLQLNLRSYRREQVSFYADLMAKGDHTIRVYARLQGDENPSNDSFERVVTCLGEPDPYVMDFEYCEASSTEITPWHVVISDTNRVIGIADYAIPHTMENWGFMAVDPLEIQNFNVEFPSRQGARYGLSLADVDPSTYEGAGAVISCMNDAWLISSRLQMPDDSSSVSFLGMSMMGTFQGVDYSDALNVMVSTRGVMPEDFQFVENVRLPAYNPEGRENPDWPWTRFTVDLSAYNGQEVYVAIQGQARNYGIFVDDIRVKAGNVANEGRAEVSAVPVEVVPNPASDRVALKAACGMERVRIFSLTGQMVYDSGEISTEVFRFNVSGLSSGLYVAKIWTPQGLATAKIVVR